MYVSLDFIFSLAVCTFLNKQWGNCFQMAYNINKQEE